MITARVVKVNMEARIAGSGLTLTVVYPPARPAATGSVPGTALVNPLTGPAPATVVVAPTPVPARVTATLKCLWLAVYGSVLSAVQIDKIEKVRPGLVPGATALATVAVKDAAVDVTQPHGDTVFTGASHVEFRGERYSILSVEPVGPAFADPYVYYVWVTGSTKQS
jgi:hypothetical protein